MAASAAAAPAAAGLGLMPVTLISGFLGAGKSTLLSHLLLNREGLRVGLIVNDMADVNVDAAALDAASLHSPAVPVHVTHATDRVVELSNGCICCTLREDLLGELLTLSADRSRFDVIVVESSGISEPLPVAEVFELAQEGSGLRLADFARLDTTVTLVDALNFPRDFASADSLAGRALAAFDGDSRCLVDLLTDQVEFADVLLVNKADLVTPEALAGTRALLQRLNPGARVLTAVRAAVPLREVLLTGAFSLARARAAPGWLRELRGAHAPETLEYGISSFIFRARRPFHGARLYALIAAGRRGALGCVLRSKGYAWLAVDGGMDEVALWSSAGRVWQLSQGRAWWVTVPAREWPAGMRALLGAPEEGGSGSGSSGGASGSSASGASGGSAGATKGVWDAVYGDRGSEIVFIGQGMDEAAVRSALAGALVSEEEWLAGRELWDEMEDPFDFFPYEDELDEDEDEDEEAGEEGGEGGGAGGGGGHGSSLGHSHDGVPCSGHGEEDGAPPPRRPTTCRIVVET